MKVKDSVPTTFHVQLIDDAWNNGCYAMTMVTKQIVNYLHYYITLLIQVIFYLRVQLLSV